MYTDNDDDDFQLSEVESWYDNNLGYFYRDDIHDFEPPLEVELFYYSVYRPVMAELKAPVREMVYRHYPYIATEFRPEIVKRIERYIEHVGHEFLLLVHRMIQYQHLGKDLREMYPEMDEWAKVYPTYRQPRYFKESFFDRFTWLTKKQKKEMIEESRREADEVFEIKEKPRFEFFDLLQRTTFKYYGEVQELDTDGWNLYNVFLFDEYTNYELNFEHYDEFIKYEFNEEDLKLPYDVYSKELFERIKKQLEEERNKDNAAND